MRRRSLAWICALVACHGSTHTEPDAARAGGDAAGDAEIDGTSDIHTSVHGTQFDAYEGKTVHAVVWDGTTSTTLGTAMQVVTGGEFLFAWSFMVDTSHYVFAYIYADENGDGACQSTEHTWSVILYNPIQNITASTAPGGDCSHF